MANSKISALTSAATVAGTEVLPIVQSSATVKVSVANLTPGLNTITAAKGGTGQTSYAVGDLLYANTTTTLAKLADVATGNAVISGGVGVAPSYGKIGLTTHVSGTLPTTNGGTGLTSFTANAIVYASSTSALAANGPIIKSTAFNVASGVTATVTISGIEYGTATVNFGGYGSAGAGYFSRALIIGGFQTATTLYDVTTLASASSASVVLGAVTKNATTVTFTVRNNGATTLQAAYYALYYGQAGTVTVVIT
jgi:hypothetical protein